MWVIFSTTVWSFDLPSLQETEYFDLSFHTNSIIT
jgi:hypothetical protein